MRHGATDPAGGVLATLRRLSPRLYELIHEHAETTLGAYARALWQPPSEPSSAEGRRARRHLLDALEAHVKAEDSPAAGVADEALRQFARCPVLQTADHSELLLDPHSFHTNILYHIGAGETGHRFLFVNAASTVTFETWRAHGPGWLNVRGARVNVFGLSRRVLTGTSICAAPGPFRFRLAVGDDHTLTRAEQTYLEELRGLLGGRSYESAPAAFAAANDLLWSSWDGARRTVPVITDDRLTASLVARHLAEERSLLSRMLFAPEVRALLEGELERISNGVGGWALPPTTQHFWGVRAGRIRPLRLADGELREAGTKEGFRLNFEREAVVRALLEGRLYPNLLLGFLALSTLPKVRVLGGHRQATYVPLINEVCRNILRALPGAEAEELLHDITQTPVDGFIAGVIEEERHPLSLLSEQPAGTQLARLSERWAATTFRESLGQLRGFEHLRRRE